MSIDFSRVRVLLLNTGLQQKDNALYQVINSLIDNTATLVKQINSTVSGGIPGGSNTDVQFNNGGVFGGSSLLTWDGSQFKIGNNSTVALGSPASLQSVATNLTVFGLFDNLSNDITKPAGTNAWVFAAITPNDATIYGAYYSLSGQVVHNGTGSVGDLEAGQFNAINLSSGHVAFMNGFSAYSINNSTGLVDQALGCSGGIENFGTGIIAQAVPFWAYAPFGGGPITWEVQFFSDAIGGTATYAFPMWFDEQGVYAIHSINTFDGVYQARPALYNPQFTKFSIPPTNFERIVEQWESNVATIRTEKGGTGTLRALNIGGNPVTINSIATIDTGGNAVFSSLKDSALTLGSVIFAGISGLLSQDNANFFWDITNHRLGIKTTSPVVSLDVRGGFQGFRSGFDASNWTSISHDGSNPYLTFQGGNGMIIYNSLLGNVSHPNLFLPNSGGLVVGGLTALGDISDKQSANGNYMLWLLRATDSGPLGLAILVENAAQSAYLYTLDVSGNCTSPGQYLIGKAANHTYSSFVLPPAQLEVDISSSSLSGILVKAAASQSANLQEWQDNSANVLVSIDKIGNLVRYRNVATAGWGIPAIYGSGRVTGQTGAVALIATYIVGASDGSFKVSANVNVTASVTHSFSVTCTYTDETNTSRVLTLSFSQLTGTFITTITNILGTGAYEGIPLHIRCKASTSITIASTGTFTSVTYNAEGNITQIA